jgi:SPP1 gp7 family putative phage head morphogenesis protein
MEDVLNETFEAAFYQTAYSAAVGTGVGIGFAKLSHSAIELAVKYPWSGAMFSERIWDNRTNLVKELRSTITNGLIKGSSVQKMSRELKNNMNSSYKDSLRLIRTETTHVVTEATSQSYEAMELNSYMFIGTLDARTSKTCQSLDGKIFKLKDKQVGVNMPPMHPNCRSAITPYFPEMQLRERRARDAEGNSFIVPNMNYEEWARIYLK